MADLEVLLAPIRADAPTGSDLRITSGDVTFEKVRGLRVSVQAENDPEGKGRDADWKAVARECTETLQAKSKDLELAVYLTEAWARQDGLGGLRDGLRLLGALCERFWDGLHPGAEAGAVDLEIRAMPLNLLGSSRAALASVAACPLFEASNPRDPGKPRRFTWSDQLESARLDEHVMAGNKPASDALLARGFMSGDEWLGRVKGLELDKLRASIDSIGECQSALAELRAVAEKYFGADASPSMIPLADLLSDVRAHLEKHLPAPVEAQAEAPAGEAAGQAAPAAQAKGPIASREDALRRLEEVAEYFRKHEPHSPVAHLVERSARWGRMPLEEVLKEVIPDQGVLAKIWDTLGVRPS